jgi:multidrug efflux pump subunit AcrA (membrane-fusion protein)
VLRIVNVDPLWLDVPAPTEDPAAAGLKVGDPAWVLMDLGGQARVANGKVIEVAPTSDPASRRRRLRAEVPNPKGPTGILAVEPGYVRFAEPSGAVLERLAKSAGAN